MPDKPSIAQPDKASIGQMLRKQREERGLTPEQAAYQSKVPLRLLQALEADDYRMLPDPAYLIGLLHEYALLLKLDPKALEAEFRSAIRRPPGGFVAPAPPQPAPPPIPWKHVLWTAAAILVVTPLVFIALSLASKRAADRPAPRGWQSAPARNRRRSRRRVRRRRSRSPPRAPEASSRGRRAGRARFPPRARQAWGLRSWRQKAPPPSPSPQTERTPRRLLLTARATETTWMAVRGDDGQERRVLLQKGADRALRFRHALPGHRGKRRRCGVEAERETHAVPREIRAGGPRSGPPAGCRGCGSGRDIIVRGRTRAVGQGQTPECDG